MLVQQVSHQLSDFPGSHMKSFLDLPLRKGTTRDLTVLSSSCLTNRISSKTRVLYYCLISEVTCQVQLLYYFSKLIVPMEYVIYLKGLSIDIDRPFLHTSNDHNVKAFTHTNGPKSTLSTSLPTQASVLYSHFF